MKIPRLKSSGNIFNWGTVGTLISSKYVQGSLKTAFFKSLSLFDLAFYESVICIPVCLGAEQQWVELVYEGACFFSWKI